MTMAERELSRSTRRAQLPHSCIICGETIERGTRYTRLSYVLPGAIDNKFRCVRFHCICPAPHPATSPTKE